MVFDMALKEIDISSFISKLTKIDHEYAAPVIDLIQARTKEPWKVVVATILSARTNDKTTAEVTTRLFKKIKSVSDFKKLSIEKIEKIIYPVGFYRNKAKYLSQLPDSLESRFDNVIPQTVEELVKLPGVGRKTANLVVAVGFDKHAICVDTHVHRIMNIWQYVDTKNPFETEMALREKLPKKHWKVVNHLLVAHGQSICRPVSPRCEDCVLNAECPKNGVTPRKSKTASKKKFTNSIKMISWNVNGIRAVEKKGFVDILKDLEADIFAVQETKAQKEQLSDDLINIDGYKSYWFSARKKGYSGVAVYSKGEPIDVHYGMGVEEFDNEGRVLTLEYDSFFLVNCYYPNAQHELKRMDYKQGFNAAVKKFCNSLKKKKTVVICGDYNVAHKAVDLKNPKTNEKNAGYSIEEREDMDRFIKAGYVDTFRMFNKEPDNYTWWSYRFNARAKNIGWRIDYFCVDSRSKSRVVSSEILPEIIGSNHCPIELRLV